MMKSAPRLCGLLLLFALLPAAWGQSSALRVARIEIKHVGPATVSDQLIRANIRVKVGDPFNQGAVDDDVQNLYATGLFYNIRVEDQITPDGVVLTYVVQGKPKLTEINFQGNTKFSDAKLRRKLTSKVGEPLDEQKLFTDSQEIQKMYQKAGYPGTQVKYVLNIDENTGRGTATFEIKEGSKSKITQVDFVGAHAFSQRKLRKVIKTRAHWMFSWLTGSGVFKEDQFEDDEDKLREFYRNNGYIDFEIKNVEFEHPTPRTMIIKFIVFEGQQYKVGSVKFTGDKLFSREDIAKGMEALQPGGALVKKVKLGPNGLKMDVGDVFTPKGMNDDVQQIEDFFGSKGYLDVSSGRNLKVTRIPNIETGTMDLAFNIDAGQKNYIERIIIRGNTKTKDRVIRRELAVSPGEVFDMVRVNQSKQIIQGLQYFSKVDVRPEPTDVPTHKNLVISVEEKNTGNLTVGAGFSSVDSLVGFAEVYQGNFDLFHPPTFTGGGQKMRLRAQLGTQRQDYEMEFIEPWFLQRRLSLDTQLFYRNWDFLSPNSLYNEVDAGGRVNLLRELPKPIFLQRLNPAAQLIGGVGYSLEDIGILFNNNYNGTTPNPVNFPGPTPPPTAVPVPNTLLAERGYTLISKFNTSLAYDTRGPGLLPEKGQRTQLSAEVAGPFGGARDYYKLELKTYWYFKGFFPGHVIEVLGGTGVADAYGSDNSVPFYDRYYLGGLDTLRGFRYRGVSPREVGSGSDEPIGGDTYWFGSVEYSLPVIERVRFALFYDVGNVMSQPYSYDFSNFNDNYGFGIRLHLPIGDLRLDYGIPIHHDQYNSGSGRFQFSVGPQRQF